VFQESELLRRLKRVPLHARADFIERLRVPNESQGTNDVSYRQEQLLRLSGLEPWKTAYNFCFGIRIRGELSLADLNAALSAIFAKHVILRTVFQSDLEGSRQIVVPPKPVSLQAEDLVSLEPFQQSRKMATITDLGVQQSFDLEAGPLVRLRLLKLSDDEHVLLWFTHYLIVDVASAELILIELADMYGAFRKNGSAPTFDPVMLYGTFAKWQRELANSEDGKASIEWWSRYLSGWTATALSPDFRRPSTIDFAGTSIDLPIPAGLLSRALKYATETGLRVEAPFVAAYAATLHICTGSDDILIGFPIRLTEPRGIERLIGNCENLTPLRVDVSGNPSFAQVAQRANASLDETITHAKVPFNLILDAARPARDPSRLPLVPMAFELELGSKPERASAGNTFLLERYPARKAGFEVLLRVNAANALPQLQAEFASSLFSKESIEQFMTRFLRCLDTSLLDPGKQIVTRSVMSDDEVESVTVLWNQTERPATKATICSAFTDRVARAPKSIAVVAHDSTMTYEELDRRSTELAWRLRNMGVGVESRVALYLQRSPAMVVAILGILKSGAAYVPVDTSYPPRRVAAILEDCTPAVLLSQQSLQEELPRGCWQTLGMEDGVGLVYHDAAAPPLELDPDNLAYILYTSGSSGKPKGVGVTHANVMNFIRSVQDEFSISPDDRFVQFASISFDVSVFEIFGALLSGARVYVLHEQERHSLDAMTDVMLKHHISIADLPPAIMELLEADRFPALRIAFVGGESFSGELVTRWARQGRRFYNGYGPTEATVTVITKCCEGVWTSSPPIGRPMANTRAYTLERDLDICPIGVPGELGLVGTNLARGYINAPGYTAEHFRPNPFGPPGSRIYMTGDLAKWSADGDLVFVGRIDRQVKVRGMRVELGEVESILSRYPLVADCVVDIASDALGTNHLVAYYVEENGAVTEPEVLRAFLSDQLPGYMVPSHFVKLDGIPLTLNGKIDRRALPVVDFAVLARPAHDETVRTHTQLRVAEEVFLPLLCVSAMSVHQNFFALGGTSIQAIKAIPRIREVFGVNFPVSEFFQNPTVAGVATVVERLQAEREISDEELLSALHEVAAYSDSEVEWRLQEFAH